MVKIERSYPPPISLEVEKKKKSGSYREKDVVLRLQADFHDKCYLCNIALQDVNVEHLRPHRGNKDLKFDWDNLFYSCPHCNFNKTKKKFDVILDCCREDPENVLDFSLNEGNVISVKSKSDRPEVLATAELLMEIFYNDKTGCRTIGMEKRRKKLLEEMNLLYTVLKKYKSDRESMRNWKVLAALLHRKSEFAAFKRAYIKLQLEKYGELGELLS